MTEQLLTGFPPIADPDARVLILGSMPGETSLRERKYYGHPRNLFWDIMGDLFGAGRDIPYRARLDRLRSRRVALWDVVHQCERSGSLDSAIDPDTIQINAFGDLFERCPDLRAVCFNGRKAEQLFRRRVLPDVKEALDTVRLQILPSTSPAHASKTRQQKANAWRSITGWL